MYFNSVFQDGLLSLIQIIFTDIKHKYTVYYRYHWPFLDQGHLLNLVLLWGILSKVLLGVPRSCDSFSATFIK